MITPSAAWAWQREENRKQIAAYKWLTRRIPVRKDAPKASSSSKKLSEDVFKSYLKHVRRQLDLTTESPSMKADVAANRELIADFGCRGGGAGELAMGANVLRRRRSHGFFFAPALPAKCNWQSPPRFTLRGHVGRRWVSLALTEGAWAKALARN